MQDNKHQWHVSREFQKKYLGHYAGSHPMSSNKPKFEIFWGDNEDGEGGYGWYWKATNSNTKHGPYLLSHRAYSDATKHA